MSTNPDAAKVRRIESHDANAMRWYAAGDADSVANLFAADAWQMPPNAPPLVGREVIRAFWKNPLNWGGTGDMATRPGGTSSRCRIRPENCGLHDRYLKQA